MASWADMCDDEEDARPWVEVKRASPQPTPAPSKSAPEPQPKGPPCYCVEPSIFDTVKKAGKHEKIGTAFVVCASGECKYWFALPVPTDLPVVDCSCGKPAAACKVKNAESRHFGKYISTCAFSKCRFFKVQP